MAFQGPFRRGCSLSLSLFAVLQPLGLPGLPGLQVASAEILFLTPNDFDSVGQPAHHLFGRSMGRLLVDFSAEVKGDATSTYMQFLKILDRDDNIPAYGQGPNLAKLSGCVVARMDCGKHYGFCRDKLMVKPWAAVRMYFEAEKGFALFPAASLAHALGNDNQGDGVRPAEVLKLRQQQLELFGMMPTLEMAQGSFKSILEQEVEKATPRFHRQKIPKDFFKKKKTWGEWASDKMFGKKVEPAFDPWEEYTRLREYNKAQERAEIILNASAQGLITKEEAEKQAAIARTSGATKETTPLQWRAALFGAGLDQLLHLNETGIEAILAPLPAGEEMPDTPRQVFVLYHGAFRTCHKEEHHLNTAKAYLREMGLGLVTFAVVDCDLFPKVCEKGGVTEYCTANHFHTRNTHEDLGATLHGTPMAHEEFIGFHLGTHMRDMAVKELPRPIRLVMQERVRIMEEERAARHAAYQAKELDRKVRLGPSERDKPTEEFDPEKWGMTPEDAERLAESLKEAFKADMNGFQTMSNALNQLAGQSAMSGLHFGMGGHGEL